MHCHQSKSVLLMQDRNVYIYIIEKGQGVAPFTSGVAMHRNHLISKKTNLPPTKKKSKKIPGLPKIHEKLTPSPKFLFLRWGPILLVGVVFGADF